MQLGRLSAGEVPGAAERKHQEGWLLKRNIITGEAGDVPTKQVCRGFAIGDLVPFGQGPYRGFRRVWFGVRHNEMLPRKLESID